MGHSDAVLRCAVVRDAVKSASAIVEQRILESVMMGGMLSPVGAEVVAHAL
jgi:hypothetical protein